MSLAAMFVKAANKHHADIWVQKDGQRGNGKSILELMTQAAGQGERIVKSAQGADAEKAVQELEKLVRRRFDEEEFLPTYIESPNCSPPPRNSSRRTVAISPILGNGSFLADT
jgi:phosphocarrier protein HPr